MLLGVALSVAVAASGSGNAFADVWPYQRKVLADGALEYAFDLTALKRGDGTADARVEHGDEVVKEFLGRLPREVKVKVQPHQALRVFALEGLEAAPLAPTFSAVGEGVWVSDNPLREGPGAKLRPPLHPDMPRLLVTATQVLWQVRQVEDGALAAALLDTEGVHREVWGKVAEQALERFKASQGDAREGALLLWARVAAAQACLDAKKVKGAGDAELKTAVQAELERLSRDVDARAAPGAFGVTPALGCAWTRQRALGQPFPASRAGMTAVLTFLTLQKADAKLAARVQVLKARRDALLGAPAADPLDVWAKVEDPAAAIDQLTSFIDGLPREAHQPPALLAWPETPFTAFVRKLEGAEKLTAQDELIAAVQDGRVAPAAGDDVPWPQAREAALVPLLRKATDDEVQVDADWRGQLEATVAALSGRHREAPPGVPLDEPESEERADLRVRLRVPPVLDVEPTALAYTRAAQSLERLEAALTALRLSGLTALWADGRRGGAVVSEVKALVPALRGLAVLADPKAPATGGDVKQRDADLRAARRYLASWRSQAVQRQDVRRAQVAADSAGGERAHAAVAGVGRRLLGVAFAAAPEAQVETEGPFEVDATGEQRYLAPVLVTVGARAKAQTPALDLASWRRAVDVAKRDLHGAEAAFIEALGADIPR